MHSLLSPVLRSPSLSSMELWGIQWREPLEGRQCVKSMQSIEQINEERGYAGQGCTKLHQLVGLKEALKQLDEEQQNAGFSF